MYASVSKVFVLSVSTWQLPCPTCSWPNPSGYVLAAPRGSLIILITSAAPGALKNWALCSSPADLTTFRSSILNC